MFWINNKNIAIIFSQKSDGNMLFTQTNTDLTRTNTEIINEIVKINRQKFFQKNNIDSFRLVNTSGVHGNFISTVTEKELGNGSLDPETRIKGADGLITNIKNSYLMITGADCFPVFFYDEKNRIIGIAHCGWKGIVNNIIFEMLNKFKENSEFEYSKLKIWIGPGIKNCHFEIKEDTKELFKKYENAIIKRNDRIYIDLPAIIKSQLKESGVESENIIEYPDCIFCQKEKWFSFRRDKPKYVEVMAFIIGLK